MENSDVVNPVQEPPLCSADCDGRNPHSSVCNLNSNSGVSGYSGNARSSLKPGSVELLASFMQDIQNIGHANSEIVRNCEVFDIQFYFLKVVLMYLLCILEDKSVMQFWVYP
uniref:Uncharacterized protein n=1 Tax=Zonotrichia albicollis TaxID=44394 RepID=A0A8D2QIK7_ZONAL